MNFNNVDAAEMKEVCIKQIKMLVKHLNTNGKNY